MRLDEWPMPDIRKYEDRTWEFTLKVIYLKSLAEKGVTLWYEAVINKQNRRYTNTGLLLYCIYQVM